MKSNLQKPFTSLLDSKESCTVCQKTPHLWLAIILTYTVRWQQFLAEVLLKSKKSDDALFSHLTYLVVLHYLAKQETQKLRPFHLNTVSLCQRTHKTHSSCYLVAAELPFIPKAIDCMNQIKIYLEREHSILLFVTHTLYVYEVCNGVGRCVKDGSCSSSSLEWKLMDSINGISY